MIEYCGCPHCQGEEAYDIGDQLGRAVSMNLGELGTVEGAMVLSIEPTRALLTIGIVHETNEHHYENIDEENVEIFYCPFCGRKLKEA